MKMPNIESGDYKASWYNPGGFKNKPLGFAVAILAFAPRLAVAALTGLQSEIILYEKASYVKDLAKVSKMYEKLQTKSTLSSEEDNLLKGLREAGSIRPNATVTTEGGTYKVKTSESLIVDSRDSSDRHQQLFIFDELVSLLDLTNPHPNKKEITDVARAIIQNKDTKPDLKKYIDDALSVIPDNFKPRFQDFRDYYNQGKYTDAHHVLFSLVHDIKLNKEGKEPSMPRKKLERSLRDQIDDLRFKLGDGVVIAPKGENDPYTVMFSKGNRIYSVELELVPEK